MNQVLQLPQFRIADDVGKLESVNISVYELFSQAFTD